MCRASLDSSQFHFPMTNLNQPLNIPLPVCSVSPSEAQGPCSVAVFSEPSEELFTVSGVDRPFQTRAVLAACTEDVLRA